MGIMALDTAIEAGCAKLGLSFEIVTKLVECIDLLKIKGEVGGYASSKFSDYLGFLQLADTEAMREFFAERWSDHMVRIPVPKEYMKYLNAEIPLFTPSRLEPQYNKTPFYEAGIEKVPTGKNTNTHDVGTVRKAGPMRESYQNFVIEQFLPPAFYIELPNESIPCVLSEGLPEVDFVNPYPLHTSAEDARQGLNKHLHHTLRRMVTPAELMRYTLVKLDSSQLEFNEDVFYTRNGLDAGSARSGGYFYIGAIPAKAISVADENIT